MLPTQANSLVLFGGYVLELEDGNYYCGISQHVCKRIGDHILNKGSRWTKLHKPVRVVETCIIMDADPKVWEKRRTLELMREYGWRRVRGGPFTRVQMNHAPACLKLNPDRPLDTFSTDVNEAGELKYE